MAMNLMHKLTWGVAGAIAIIGLVCALVGQRINVTAKGYVSVYDKPMDGRIVKVLQPGEMVAVVACEDLKHYIAPVVLVDGHRAYLQEGAYRLDRKAAWDFGAGPVSLSCP